LQTELEKAHIHQAKTTWNSLNKMYWLLDSKSQLSIENKLLLYKTILGTKPISAYGVQLWGTASNSNIEILQGFQNQYLRIMVTVPLCVTNDTLYHDVNVRDEIKKFSQRFIDRIEEHPNILMTNLINKVKTTYRLKRKLPQDLYIWSYCNLYSIRRWTYALQDFHKLSHILPNVT